METASKVQDNPNIEQVRDGSKDACRFLFDTIGPRIHVFAFSYVKYEADAEELLQEVFLKLWEVRSTLDISKNIKSFLFKIFINLIFPYIKHLQ